MGKWPECEKMARAQDRSRLIGDFLDWLLDHNMVIAEYPKRCSHFREGRQCRPHPEREWPECGTGCEDYDGEEMSDLEQVRMSKEQLLANYFEIDLQAVERERCAMLDECRAQHEKGT
jgi:hypothetical protein